MSERHLTKDLFYSYPDCLIAQVCVVHIQTARHWNSGIRKPGATALRLWSLYTDGRILTDEWTRWGVRGASAGTLTAEIGRTRPFPTPGNISGGAYRRCAGPCVQDRRSSSCSSR
jgi:hypothetical protein